MDPTRFSFTLSVPRDSHVVTLVRLIAEKAARYARCESAAAEAFAGSVEEAVRACFESAPSDEPVSILVRRDAGPIEIVVDGRAVSVEP
jgi:hypothetical protein